MTACVSALALVHVPLVFYAHFLPDLCPFENNSIFLPSPFHPTGSSLFLCKIRTVDLVLTTSYPDDSK